MVTPAHVTYSGDIHDIDDNKLLSYYDSALEEEARCKEVKGRIEQELFRRMQERKATGIPSSQYECKLKMKYTYDPSVLVQLKEVITNDDDLRQFWTPEHSEVSIVPEKFNATKAWPVARKYGDKAVSIMEQAKVEAGRSIDFDRKDSK